MLEMVPVCRRSVDAYRGIAPDSDLDALVEAARDFRGARVLHLTQTGGAGPDLDQVRSTVGVLSGLGFVAHWKTLPGAGVLPKSAGVTEKSTGEVARVNRTAALLEEDYDFVFVHGDELAPIVDLHGRGRARWVWCSPTPPDLAAWPVLGAHLATFDAVVVPFADAATGDIPTRVSVLEPAIDPLSPSNLPIPKATARHVLAWRGLCADRPLICHALSPDQQGDPLELVEAYSRIRDRFPGLQLALLGPGTPRTPQPDLLRLCLQAEHARDPSIHLLMGTAAPGPLEVNALVGLASVVVHDAIDPGTGPCETVWKETPVITSPGARIAPAVAAAGLVARGTDECAAALMALLGDPAHARVLGCRGREEVRQRFLLPQRVLHELALIRDLARGSVSSHDEDWLATHDPVCGMLVEQPGDAATEWRAHGRFFRFCSLACRREFASAPGGYLGPRHEAPHALCREKEDLS